MPLVAVKPAASILFSISARRSVIESTCSLTASFSSCRVLNRLNDRFLVRDQFFVAFSQGESDKKVRGVGLCTRCDLLRRAIHCLRSFCTSRFPQRQLLLPVASPYENLNLAGSNRSWCPIVDAILHFPTFFRHSFGSSKSQL